MKQRKLKIAHTPTAKEIAIMVAVLLFFSWLMVVFCHGCYRDFVVDKMHGSECYWCNAYRLGHMDNAAFQTRELRRNGGGK